jgi:BON domain
MAERYQPYEDEYGRGWRGGDRSREQSYRPRDEWRAGSEHGEERWARDRERERNDWRDRGEWRGAERGEGRGSEPEWRGSREWRAGERDWRGEGDRGYGRPLGIGRGSYERERYPDENYGGRAYGRGGMHDDSSDQRRSSWERGAGDWRTVSRDRGQERSGWSDRGQFGYEDEGIGYSGQYSDDYRRGQRGLYGTESDEGASYRHGDYTGARMGGQYGSPQHGYGGSQYNEGQRYASFMGRGPKDYRRSDDRIREDVSDRLTDDPLVDASDLTVQVKDSEVTLTGTVENREQKRRAEDLAERVSGVREVTNQLRVNKGFFSQLFGTGEEHERGQQQRPQQGAQSTQPSQQTPGTQQRPKVSS